MDQNNKCNRIYREKQVIVKYRYTYQSDGFDDQIVTELSSFSKRTEGRTIKKTIKLIYFEYIQNKTINTIILYKQNKKEKNSNHK